MNKTVSLNVLNYNTFDKTKVCIDSCLKQKGLAYQVILIDNCSTDDSFSRLKQLYGDKICYLLNDQNYGYAKGNNLGVIYSLKLGFKYSFILNSDTELIGDSLLSELVGIISKEDNCAVLSPTIYDVTQNGLDLHSNDSFYLRLLRVGRVIPNNKKVGYNLNRISEAHGSALMVENDIFLKVGGFPEHYFMYCEESTFCKKILWNGNSILWLLDTKKYVLHHHDKTGNVAPWRLYLMGRNRGIEYWENYKSHNWTWTIIYRVFMLKSYFHSIVSGDRSYYEGMKDSKILFESKLTNEKYLEHAINKVNQLK